MSFGFTFADDELDSDIQDVIGGVDGVSIAKGSGGVGDGNEASAGKKDGWSTRVSSKRWSLEDLLPSLPPRISYSSLRVPLDDGRTATIHRRDLFDARFQMLIDDGDEDGSEAGTEKGQSQSEDEERERKAQRQEVEVKDSDLVPGVYEGGLKTWECSLDVVRELEKRFGGDQGRWQELRGRRILELGCGTAIPSVYLLRKLVELPASGDTKRTLLHLCDFNIEVLRLVTLPNLLLSFAFSSAAATSPSDDSGAGELELKPSLLESFTWALRERNIDLVFGSGAWESLEASPATSDEGSDYDVVLSSETIYNLDTLPSLLGLLKRSIRASSKPSQTLTASPDLPLTLIAAKILYFGVGGGVTHFVDAWTKEGGSQGGAWCVTAREVREGVGRVVLQIGLQGGRA